MVKVENQDTICVLPQKIVPIFKSDSGGKESISHSDPTSLSVSGEIKPFITVSLEEGLNTPTEDISGIIYDSSEMGTSVTPVLDYSDDISLAVADLGLGASDLLELTYSEGIDIQMAKKTGNDGERAKKRRERQRERDKVKHDNGLGSGTRVETITIPGKGPIPCIRRKGKWKPIK